MHLLESASFTIEVGAGGMMMITKDLENDLAWQIELCRTKWV